MKVKIKKKDKVKEFNLIKSWSDVTLEKWLKLIDYTTKSKTHEALSMISELSDIPKKIIRQLEIADVVSILNQLTKIQNEKDTSLKNVIEINNVKYGFHPDLNSLTLGEYADLETYLSKNTEKYMPEIMAILYRPIEEEGDNDIYTIEAYDGNIRLRAEQMKQMSAEQVQSALVFFYNIVSVSLMIMQLYLTEQVKEKKKQ